ncbi:MAG TPA: type II secretion system F family protein [Candidatus Dormibacteraeota bacterium]
MAEVLAALAGACTTVAILAMTDTRPPVPWLAGLLDGEVARAAALWGPGVDWRLPLVLQLAAGVAAGLTAGGLTALPVLAAAGGVLGLASTRMALGVALRGRVRARQDAVLESVRTLRGLLEAGGVGVQQGLTVLAERGPRPLREEFRALVAAGAAGRQPAAWARARTRVDDPLFDLLSAAVLVQRPGGGALGPLFADLEESVAAIHEVTREAEALQVQARSAAAVIVLLPVVFLLVLSALRSPYLDAYHRLGGALFLAGALTVIGLSYLWMQRWLRLPGEPRLAVAE